MLRRVVITCFLAVGTLSAQETRDSLAGIVTDHHGAVVADAPILLKHTDTGVIARTRSAADGHFTFANLPAGGYELSINMPCCLLGPFRRTDITLVAGQPLRIDVQLEEGSSLNTAGDDPGAIRELVRRRSIIPATAVPRTVDGHPDLSGVWLVDTDPYPEQSVRLPAINRPAPERTELNTGTRCLPSGLPVPNSAPPWLAKFVQTPTLIVILSEGVPGFRQVFLDGRAHPIDPNPTWMGHSIGVWDGDTLVVDTVGFNGKLPAGGPSTEQLHMVERYRRVEFGRLETRVTFEDPGALSQPLNRSATWDLAPGEEIMEFVCENNKLEHIVNR